MSKSAPSARAQALDVARTLVAIAEIDTVYRDVYLLRARQVLAAELPAAAYRALAAEREGLEKARRSVRTAVASRDWARVKELSEAAAGLQRAVESRAEDLAVGDRAYEAPDVCIDPFSPGAELVLAQRGVQPSAVAESGRQALARLERIDADHAAFYAGRRGYLAALTFVAPEPERREETTDAAELEREAGRLADRGDVGGLGRLADRLLAHRGRPEPTAPAERAPARGVCPVDLAAPFPAGAIERARSLGLAHREMEAPGREAVQSFLDALNRNAWHPSFRGSTIAYDGVQRLEQSIPGGLPQELAKGLVELAHLFVLHPYVTSGGSRYLPGFGRESLLIEDHAEGEAESAPSELLAAVGLPRRTALARTAIEKALLERGPQIVRDRLQLDPTEFKLVCAPFDAYLRVGAQLGWGRLERHWTHLDGYEVVRGPSFRALCGGDARYGGLFDLVSIAADDERESVHVRLAVIRRARLVSRWS